MTQLIKAQEIKSDLNRAGIWSEVVLDNNGTIWASVALTGDRVILAGLFGARIVAGNQTIEIISSYDEPQQPRTIALDIKNYLTGIHAEKAGA